MISIRQEVKEDQLDIYAIHKAAFGRDNEARLVDLLRESTAFVPELSLVAVTEGNVVGHILFSRIKINDQNQREHESLSLAPMAVNPEYQKKGIGAQLIRSGIERARELAYKSIIVLGHENYYPKFGFVPAIKWNIAPPFDVPNNVFMGIELVENGLRDIEGMVIYPREFEMV